MEYLISFSSTHVALKAESLLKEKEILFKLLPAPKEIAATCALVIGVDAPALDETLALLSESRAEGEKVFKREDKEYVEV